MHRGEVRGRVVDEYIPPKVTNYGERFGFVRYKEVTNKLILEKELDALRIDSYKLKVNLSWFNRSKERMYEANDEKTVAMQKENSLRTHKEIKGGVSFAEVDKGTEGQLSRKTLGVNSLASLTYEPSKGKFEWLQKCMVGTLRELQNGYTFQDKLHMHGLYTVNATPMVGNQVLLSVDEEDSIREIIVAEKSWFNVWFEEISHWTHDVVSRQRFAWLRIFGILLHVWEEDFFKHLASNFGTYLSVDEHTEKRKRLDVAKVFISTSSIGNIDCIMRLQSRGEFII